MLRKCQSAVFLLVVPFLILTACNDGNNNGNNGGFFIPPFTFSCTPPDAISAIDPLDLLFGAILFETLIADGVPDQTVEVSFGSGITAATNLSDDSTMDTTGDVGTTGPSGQLNVQADCADLTDTANPCSLTFTTTVDGVQFTCTAGPYFD